MERHFEKKDILRMKLTGFLVLFAFLQLSASSFSQTITLHVKQEKLHAVIQAIRKQSGYNFLYNDRLLHKSKPVTLSISQQPVEETLKQLFEHQPLDFTIMQRTVVLSDKSPRVPKITDHSLAQSAIKGLVTDSLQRPLQGVTIRLKGTTQVVTTNDQGQFSLPHVPSGTTLVFSMVGYRSIEQVLTDQTFLTVVLHEDASLLSEVVINVGYSTAKQGDLTSAVSVINTDKLLDVTANNVGSMLQGKVAGLQVVNSSGAPGSAPEIRLRGVSSVNASQEPLVVVDGIIGGAYDPNDVANITVLKDAAATALYGSQANAGVLIITTKKGTNTGTQLEASASGGVRTADFGKMDMMPAEALYEYQKEFYRDYIPGLSNNSYKIDLIKFYSERPLSLRQQNYDWVGESFAPAPIFNFYVSAKGQTEKNNYYAALSYYKEKGTFLNTDFQRINLRANSTYTFSKKISVSNNINISGSIGKGYDYMDMYYAFLNLPWDNPYNADGSPLYVDGSSPFKWWSRDKVNPVHTIQHSDHPYKGIGIHYDFVFNYQFTSWLKFVSSSRVSGSYDKATNYYSPDVAGTYHGTGYLEELNTLNYGVISNNLFHVDLNLNKHHLSGLAGVAIENGRTEVSGGGGKGLPERLRVLNVVANNQFVNGNFDKSIIQSLITQVNYDYLGKYYLSASYRLDGSSAFPPGNQWASFPALSAAWQMNREDFMRDISAIDLFKVRLSYGVTGTQDIGASRFLGLYSLTGQYNALTAAIPYQLANPLLTWESKHQFNAGLDVGLFKRLNVTVDAYHNVTKDLLLQVSQPLSIGFETRWENAGQVVNKGIELGVSATNIEHENFSWATDLSLNVNQNRLKELPSQIIKTGSWSISQIYRNDGNLYEFYMPKWLGVNTETGAPQWEKVLTDEAGNITSREATANYAEATLQEMGSALPSWQGGFNNTFHYGNIGLRINTAFSWGNKIYSNNLRFVMNDGHEPYYNQINMPDDYHIWTGPGDVATNPSPQNSANSNETSSRYLFSGAYFTIRNVALSYDLPKNWVNQINMAAISLSLTADNVYTFTSFLGQDPQTTITPSANVTPGVSDFKYPNNRQFLFRINCSF
ncbi:TonB-dependent receptor [Olivibacter ginsenosidimutans]|uniref:TonB-dependent receptor n=1 Tax=Olivibacter ginsenosidimutans TaxID=1176537 RepID=A0ABP9BB32_9SPHI